MVELKEWDSITSLNQEQTGEQIFKTAATTRVSSSLDKSQVSVSYHWDSRLGHVDLQKADIRLPSAMITYPHCLDRIEVSRSEVKVTTGPSLSSSRVAPASRGQSLRYLGQDKQFNPQLQVNTASTLPARISYSVMYLSVYLNTEVYFKGCCQGLIIKRLLNIPVFLLNSSNVSDT